MSMLVVLSSIERSYVNKYSRRQHRKAPDVMLVLGLHVHAHTCMFILININTFTYVTICVRIVYACRYTKGHTYAYIASTL